MLRNVVVSLKEFNNILEAILVLDDFKQQVQENIVNLWFPILNKSLLELVSFEADEVMHNKEVPSEPVLLRHLIQNMNIVNCLNLFKIDAFIPFWGGDICPAP